MTTNIVTIDLDQNRSYDIYIGGALLPRIAELVPEAVQGGRFFLLSDENVKGYAESLVNSLKVAGAKQTEVKILPAGEGTKSIDQFSKVMDWLLEHKIERSSVVVAVGGGVIGDLSGYAAASALRGVHYVQVPTSLLAQVDSSVGGKTGINSKHGKNLIGAFYQPKAVIADTDVLKTLPRRELLAGYAEVVKYGVLGDSSFFDWLEENGSKVCALSTEELTYAIETSVKAKAEIVKADELEGGVRALLNFGHTFAHALEASAGYNGTLLHGEAVSVGMVMAMDLSARMELCPDEAKERVEAHLSHIGLPVKASQISNLYTTVDEQLELMRGDKKVKDGKMTFILAHDIGNAFISQDVDEALVRAVVQESLGGDTKHGGQHGLINKAFTNEGVKGLWKTVFSSRSSAQA